MTSRHTLAVQLSTGVGISCDHSRTPPIPKRVKTASTPSSSALRSHGSSRSRGGTRMRAPGSTQAGQACHWPAKPPTHQGSTSRSALHSQFRPHLPLALSAHRGTTIAPPGPCSASPGCLAGPGTHQACTPGSQEPRQAHAATDRRRRRSVSRTVPAASAAASPVIKGPGNGSASAVPVIQAMPESVVLGGALAAGVSPSLAWSLRRGDTRKLLPGPNPASRCRAAWMSSLISSKARPVTRSTTTTCRWPGPINSNS